jgi:regulator of cell morphogenesis and NO signaling
MNTTESLFVPALEPSLKHPTVFRKFDELQVGDTLVLVNDHDPIPLFYEMKAERGEIFEWKKVENGPEQWKVEITKTAAVAGKTNTITETKNQVTKEIFVLNVTLIEPRFKHPTIFSHFDELKPGEAFQILNDHDPKPLYYQLIAERGNTFTWTYLEKGSQWWRVQIQKNDAGKGETVGQIAAKDMRKAEVFKKYGIDFCCGGKKSLKQVCDEKGLDLASVEAELDNAKESAAVAENFERWQPDFLADYIYNKHHVYYYDEAPVINDLLTKVVGKHGKHFPELEQVFSLYLTLVQELNTHFMKEEKVIFPFIKALVQAKKNGNIEEVINEFSLFQPLQIMESDHEAAGEILAQLREVTNEYNAPQGACNSFQFTYKKLKALDEDLHQHIHLENNILFPKALSLEKELRK